MVGGGEETKEFTYEYITNNLWNAVDEKNGVPIYPKLKVETLPLNDFFSEYCWIKPKNQEKKYGKKYNYGQGFFLYTIIPEAKQIFEDYNLKNNNIYKVFNKPLESTLYKYAPDSYAILRKDP